MGKDNIILKDLCDELLLLSVKTASSVSGAVLSMNEINDEYVYILEEHDIRGHYSGHHKMHPKELIQEYIPDVEIVKSVRKN